MLQPGPTLDRLTSQEEEPRTLNLNGTSATSQTAPRRELESASNLNGTSESSQPRIDAKPATNTQQRKSLHRTPSNVFAELQVESSARQTPKTPKPRNPKEHPNCADVILVFPVSDANDPKASEMIEPQKAVEEIFVARGDGDHSNFQERIARIRGRGFPSVSEVCAPGGNMPTLHQLRNAIIEDCSRWLPEQGFNVQLFASIDKDETFMRISLDDPDMQRYYCTKFKYRLQTTYELIDGLGIGQRKDQVKQYTFWNYDDQVSPCYAHYHPDLELLAETIPEMQGKPAYRNYFGKDPDGRVLRMVDCIRIIYMSIGEVLNLKALEHQGLIVAHYPVHRRCPLEEFSVYWANLRVGHPGKILSKLHKHHVPSPNRIRSYFGEDVAFYFVWLDFTCKCLFGLVIAACVVFLLDALGYWPHVGPTWVVVLAIWSSVYSRVWAQHEFHHQSLWDMSNVDEQGVVRPDFKGQLVKDNVDFNSPKLKLEFPAWRRRYTKLVSGVVMITSLGVVLTCVVCLLYCRHTIISWSEQESVKQQLGVLAPIFSGTTIVSILMAVQIQVFNRIWAHIAKKLVVFENPHTVFEYQNSLVWKVFLFQAINSYNNFYFTAFFLEVSPTGCPRDHCMGVLSKSLYTTQISLAFMGLVEMALPYITIQMALRDERKKARAQSSSSNERSQILETHQNYSFMETQAKSMKYDTDACVDDFVTLVISLGYVIIFSVAAPGVSAICLFTFFTQAKCDAWKLCNTFRRPYPFMVSGIGAWNGVLDGLGWVGLGTSIMIVCRHHSTMSVVLGFSVILGIKYGIGHLIPAESEVTHLMLDRRHKVSEVIKHKLASLISHCEANKESALGRRREKLLQMSTNIKPAASVVQHLSAPGGVPRLDEGNPEWQLVDKAWDVLVDGAPKAAKTARPGIEDAV